MASPCIKVVKWWSPDAQPSAQLSVNGVPSGVTNEVTYLGTFIDPLINTYPADQRMGIEAEVLDVIMGQTQALVGSSRYTAYDLVGRVFQMMSNYDLVPSDWAASGYSGYNEPSPGKDGLVKRTIASAKQAYVLLGEGSEHNNLVLRVKAGSEYLKSLGDQIRSKAKALTDEYNVVTQAGRQALDPLVAKAGKAWSCMEYAKNAVMAFNEAYSSASIKNGGADISASNVRGLTQILDGNFEIAQVFPAVITIGRKPGAPQPPARGGLPFGLAPASGAPGGGLGSGGGNGSDGDGDGGDGGETETPKQEVAPKKWNPWVIAGIAVASIAAVGGISYYVVSSRQQRVLSLPPSRSSRIRSLSSSR